MNSRATQRRSYKDAIRICGAFHAPADRSQFCEKVLTRARTSVWRRITGNRLRLVRLCILYWQNEAPALEGGIFMALWALQHACEVNPGGIKEPVTIAVLAREKGKLRARILVDAELAAGRAVTIYPVCLLFRFSIWAIPMRDQHILWWGGLRGALALALALPPSFPLYNEILITAFGVVMFAVVVQGANHAIASAEAKIKLRERKRSPFNSGGDL